MTTENALLAAIRAAPNEDTPRLMYADWLDEHDQHPRAEFIRVQCDIARLDEWDEPERVATLKARERELWERHSTEWRAKLKGDLWHAEFRRGFVYPRQLQLTGEQFLKLKPRTLAAAPQWSVALYSLDRTFDAVFASPHLLCVGSLALGGVSHPYDQFERFAGNDRLRNVTELAMSGQQGMPASLTAFLSSPASASITRLMFGEMDTFRFTALRASEAARRLRHLQMILFGKLPGAPLLDAETFPQLRSLDVSNFHFSYQRDEAATLEAFFTNRPRTQLRALNLLACGITNAGMEQLAAWPGLSNLRWLNLDRNHFGEAGFRAIARSPHLGDLKYLELDGWQLRHLPEVRAELDARFGTALHYYKL